MKRSMLWLACLSVGLIPCLIPGLARAGNGSHPRTPVDWSSAPCMTIIDRSRQGPIYALEYDIPYEDTEVTPDEVPDSRTHQFFAYCRDRHPEDILPGWITEADVLAADQMGLGDASNVDFELHVLENTPVWAGCWSRITGDDERRPITFAAAAEPIMWDTTTLPTGSYVVDGYTYEPWYNLWTQHPGVFKIVDDPDPAANGPAAALTFFEQTLTYGVDEASISGCVDAMDGSTMTLSWSNGNINGEPNWEVFSADLPAQVGMFDLPFAPPLEAVSNAVLIRLEVSDPMGRTWTAYSREYITVVEDVGGEESGCDEGGFVGNPCDDAGTDTGAEADTGSGSGSAEGTDGAEAGGTSSGPPISEEGGGSGCGCASAPSGRSGGLAGALALLVLVLGLRRREARG